MNRICEAFNCRPSQAYQEWLRLPVGLLEEVLEARAYEQAKSMTDAADTSEARKRLPQTPLFEMVKDIEFALADEEMQARSNG